MSSQKKTATSNGQVVDLNKVKVFLTNSLFRELGVDQLPPDQVRKSAHQYLAQVYSKTGLQFPEDVQKQLFKEVLDELTGYGPLQPLLDDPDTSEVMVNGPKNVYIELNGKLIKTDVVFENDEHVLRVIDRIISPLGRNIDTDHPTVDARLPDGSRVPTL